MTELLEKKLDEIGDLLMNIQQYKIDIQLISDPYTEYFKNYISKSRFFHRVYWNSIKLLVIDLYKLISPNEHFSFRCLLNFVLSNRNNVNWKKELSIDEIKQLIKRIKTLENNHLNDIEILRNKHYAHNDKNKDNFNIHLKLIECWDLNKNYQQIYNKISHHLNKRTFAINQYGDKPQEPINAYNYDQIRNLILDKSSQFKETVELDELREFI